MRIAITLGLLLSLSPSRAPAAEPELLYQVGVAKVDVTPDHAIRLNGFGFRRAESEGVYQKIHARALAIDDGTKSPAVLMAVDVLGIPAEVHDEVAKRHEDQGILTPERGPSIERAPFLEVAIFLFELRAEFFEWCPPLSSLERIDVRIPSSEPERTAIAVDDEHVRNDLGVGGGIQPRVVSIGVALGDALSDGGRADLKVQDGANELSVEGLFELCSGDVNVALKPFPCGGAQLADPLVLEHSQRRKDDQQGHCDQRGP